MYFVTILHNYKTPWFEIVGAKCHVKDKQVLIFGDFVIGPCPCVEGLTCVHTDEKKEVNI